MGNQSWNYYEVLEVSPEASQDIIYDAYKKAKQTYSIKNPDIFNIFSETEAIDWMNTIEEAYSIIGQPNSRRVYDQEMSSGVKKQSPIKKSVPVAAKPLPEGWAQTSVSQYPINRSMEELIAQQELYDGLFLKKIREYKKIDLNDFSRVTCIAIRHLYAIENNNFASLPAAVYVRGYIIQYSRILGLDEQRVVTSFMSLLKK